MHNGVGYELHVCYRIDVQRLRVLRFDRSGIDSTTSGDFGKVQCGRDERNNHGRSQQLADVGLHAGWQPELKLLNTCFAASNRLANGMPRLNLDRIAYVSGCQMAEGEQR